jgi:hypothetical protein
MSELDHNEVVGWVKPFGSMHAVIALRSGPRAARDRGALPALARHRA